MQRLKFELRLMLHGWGVRLAILIFLAAGLLAVVQGVNRVNRDAAHAEFLQNNFQQELSYWQERAQSGSLDFGSMGYYFFSPTFLPADPWAALVSGQRDTAMLKHRIRLLAVSGQLYGSEIHNPNMQLLGRLDLAFVFVYLLPLIIGLLCARLLAEEVHSGRWPLINALASQAILRYRLCVRFCFLLILNSLILVAGALIAAIPFDITLLVVLLAVTAYQLFWFALCGFIIRWKLNSVNSYLSFISAWLLFVIITPGLSSLFLSTMYHTDSGTALSIQQREAMHSAWDKDKQKSLDEFLSIYPQFADTPKLAEVFHWKWYFAMQHMSDLAVAAQAKEYHHMITKRASAFEKLQWLSPAIVLQQLLERIANTNIQAQQHYLKSIESYHDQLRQFFNERLFYEKSITPQELSAYPRFNVALEKPSLPFFEVFALGLMSMFLLWLSLRNAARVKSSARPISLDRNESNLLY